MTEYTLNNALSDVRKVIEDESSALSRMEPKGLFGPVRYTLDLGGKRIRPLLALLAYRAYNPSGPISDVAPVMKAVELFHNFSLIHDDLMDDAPIRRGKPTVYKEWGSNQAVLSGDAMLIEAYTDLGEAKSQALPELLRVFNQMAQGVCIGQQMDMAFEETPLREITKEDYLRMITYKTGDLLTGSAILGALLGGLQDEEERRHLTESVNRFGAAFQIMDDYLDLFSDVEQFGKRRGGDIVEGKKTWLLLDAFSKDPHRVEEALKLRDNNEKIEAMTEVYRELSTDKDALSRVETLTHEAATELGMLSKETSLLSELYLSLIRRPL